MLIENPRISLVVPTYNEALNIVDFLKTAHLALGAISHEIIVVDDDSPDQTWRIATDFASKNSWARVLRRQGEKGLSSAVLRGFEIARGELLGVMDADLSHDETILPKLIHEIDNGADLAVGSRRVSGGGATNWPWYRRLTSWVAVMMARFILRLDFADATSGYFVCRRSLYENSKARLAPQGYKILLELACKGRPRVTKEVPFLFKDRTQGYSKLSRRVMSQYLVMLARLKWESFRR